MYFCAMEEWYHYIFLALLGVLVAFINTLAGGGSLLTLPILIFMGLPPSVANGTNRIAILIQGVANVVGYKCKSVPDLFGICRLPLLLVH